MQYLSYVIKKAVDRGVVKEDDFYLQEKSFIDLLIKDKEIKQLWDDFRQLNCVYKGKNKEFFCKQIPAKKRYIDVYVENKGRISTFLIIATLTSTFFFARIEKIIYIIRHFLEEGKRGKFHGYNYR